MGSPATRPTAGRALRALGAGVLVASAALWATTTRSSVRAAAPGLPHVVVIVVDTLRADRVRVLGPRLPYLSRLRKAGMSFERVMSPSSWTPTATASIFTGLYPHQHGVRSGYLALQTKQLSPVDRLPQAVQTLPMVMKAAGYRTIGVSDNVNVGETMGFAQGFDVFSQHGDAGAEVITRRARRALSRGDGPYFLHLHLMDPHAPYRRRRGYRAPSTGGPDAAARARYDSEIVHVDRALAALHRAAGWDRGTLVVFTSDHGEAFGEHDSHGHPNQLYQELLSVPLLFFSPGRVQPGEVQQRVSTVDLLPTLRGFLSLPEAQGEAGVDLSPTLRGQATPPPRALLSMRFSDFVQPPLERRAVVAEGFKLIEYAPTGRAELFDLQTDPGETTDLARVHPGRVQALHRTLREAEARGPRHAATRIPVAADSADSARLMKRLRALGYGQ